MSQLSKEFKRILEEKIVLYQDLSSLVVKEKDSIMGMEIEKLWKFMGKKQELIEKIANKRKDIIDLFTKFKISHNLKLDNFNIIKAVEIVEKETKENFQDLVKQSVKVKNTIYKKAEYNKDFIEEFLSVINGILNSFKQKVSSSEIIYNNKRSIQNNSMAINRIISQEA